MISLTFKITPNLSMIQNTLEELIQLSDYQILQLSFKLPNQPFQHFMKCLIKLLLTSPKYFLKTLENQETTFMCRNSMLYNNSVSYLISNWNTIKSILQDGFKSLISVTKACFTKLSLYHDLYPYLHPFLHFPSSSSIDILQLFLS